MPAYLDKHGRPSHPSDLEQGHVVIRTIASRTHRPFLIVVTKNRERVEVRNRRGLSSNDIMACLTMGLAGLGVVHVLTFSAMTHLQSGALEAVLNDWVSDPIPVFIAYPPNRHLSTKARVFIDWLAELFASNELTAKSKRGTNARRIPHSATRLTGADRSSTTLLEFKFHRKKRMAGGHVDIYR
jgi:DNA-binding transcriptional LysR family regulator